MSLLFLSWYSSTTTATTTEQRPRYAYRHNRRSKVIVLLSLVLLLSTTAAAAAAAAMTSATTTTDSNALLPSFPSSSSSLLICTLIDGSVITLNGDDGTLRSFFETGRDLVSTASKYERVVPDLDGNLYLKRTMKILPLTIDDILQAPVRTCVEDDVSHETECGIVTGTKLTSLYGMDASSGKLVWSTHSSNTPSSSSTSSSTSTIDVVVLQREDYIVQHISTATNKPSTFTNTKAFLPTSVQKERKSVANVQTMGLFGLGPAEIAIIVVAVLFVLGPDKISELVRESGKVAGELKDEARQVPDEFKKGLEEGQTNVRSKKAKKMEQVTADDESLNE
jgi:Sec-independent protein translocase protein TatA